MKSELLHIYGPFSIHSYGLFIVIGIVLFMELIKRDERFKALNIRAIFTNVVIAGGFIGLLGGRILFLLTEQETLCLSDVYRFWEGGFSVLGGIVALLVFFPWLLLYYRIPLLPFLDVVAIYAPIILSVSRIGCFFAGCCYGMPTNVPWGVCYLDRTSYAPLGVTIHPTQLYSALLLFGSFLLLYFVLRKIFLKPGQLVCSFLFLHAAERFIVDFWRADRVMSSYVPLLSFYQLIAVGLMLFACVGFYCATKYGSNSGTLSHHE
jgi:phosphatidylglycerol:prolipoprotein diacylglycerol transferase